MIRIPRKPKRIVELEDEGAFAVAMQQAEGIRRNARAFLPDRRQSVEVVIQVSHEKEGRYTRYEPVLGITVPREREWEDWGVFWSGPWRPTWEGGVPLPDDATLRNEAQKAGAYSARSVVRSAI